MELREVYVKKSIEMEYVNSLNIPAFLLFDRPIDKAHKPEFVLKDLDDIYVY